MEMTRLRRKDHFYFYHGDECLSINFNERIYRLVGLRREYNEVPAAPEEFLEVARKYNFTLDALQNI